MLNGKKNAQIAAKTKQPVSSADAAAVEKILGQIPAFFAKEETGDNSAPAYHGRTYWYFSREGDLLGRASVVTYADGRVEGLWWDRQGNRPEIFDYLESPPSFLPG